MILQAVHSMVPVAFQTLMLPAISQCIRKLPYLKSRLALDVLAVHTRRHQPITILEKLQVFAVKKMLAGIERTQVTEWLSSHYWYGKGCTGSWLKFRFLSFCYRPPHTEAELVISRSWRGIGTNQKCSACSMERNICGAMGIWLLELNGDHDCELLEYEFDPDL